MTDLENHVWQALALIESQIRQRGGALTFTLTDPGVRIDYRDRTGAAEQTDTADCLAVGVLRVYRRWRHSPSGEAVMVGDRPKAAP